MDYKKVKEELDRLSKDLKNPTSKQTTKESTKLDSKSNISSNTIEKSKLTDKQGSIKDKSNNKNDNNTCRIEITSTFKVIKNNNNYDDIFNTKTLLKFNSDNQKVEEIEYDSNGKEEEKKIYIYNDNSQLIELDIQRDIPYSRNSKIKYEYDFNKNLTKKIENEEYERVYTYDNNNLLIYKKVHNINPDSICCGDIYEENTYKYDMKNNLIEEKKIIHNSEFSIGMSFHIFRKYDDKNNNIETTQWIDGKESIFLYEYDHFNNRVKEYRNKILVTKRSYDDKNRCNLVEQYQDNDVVYISETKYDSNTKIMISYDIKDGVKIPRHKVIKEIKNI